MLTQEILARTHKADLSAPSPGMRTFDVRIEPRGTGFVGDLSIHDGSKPAGQRTIDAEECGELVSALALLVALAIDPQASSAPIRELRKPPQPAPTLPALAVALPAAPFHGPGPQQDEWRGRLGMTLTLAGWIAPRPLPGMEGYFELQRFHPDRVFPSVRLGLWMAWSDGLGQGSDAARWRWTSARLQACPLNVPMSPLVWQSCLAMDLGVVRSTGTEIAHPAEQTSTWLAFGLTQGLMVEQGAWFGEFRGALWVPTTRYRFGFSVPDVEVHRVTAVGASVHLGGGVRFF